MKTNLQFFLNTYDDLLPTAAPSRNNFKWLREINGIGFNTENDQQIQILTSITTPNIVPYPFSSPTNSGTYLLNSTNIMNVTGPTDGIVVGNLVIGGGILPGTIVLAIPLTQFTFTVSAANATTGAIYSNSSENYTVTSTISSGTTLLATGSSTPPSSGVLTLVSGTGDATITFSSYTESTLITMSRAATTTGSSGISFYSPASFVYFESDQQVSVIYNNGSAMVLNPFQINGLIQPAVFFMAGPVYSLTVTNLSSATANVFLASMG